MRITASWFGSLGPPNTRTRHDLFVRDTRAPLQSSFRSQQACRRARSRQGQACGGRRRAASPDRSCARRLIDRVGRDEETGFQVEQRNRNEGKKNAVNLPLDFPSPIQGFSDAEMLGSPHARTVGVGEAPRHEVAAIGAGGCNGRYGDLIGAQALIAGSRCPWTFTRTRYRHASGLEGLWERGCASLRSGDLRGRSDAFSQVGSLPAQDQRIGATKLRAGSCVCLMTCRS
jgi:hypothetical protein